MRVLVGRCVELGEGELPYAPVAGALRALPAQLEPAELDGGARAGARRARRGSCPTWARPRDEAGDPARVRARRACSSCCCGVLGRLGARAAGAARDRGPALGGRLDARPAALPGRAAPARERLALVLTYRTDDLPSRASAAPVPRRARARPARRRASSCAPFSRAEFADHVGAAARARCRARRRSTGCSSARRATRSSPRSCSPPPDAVPRCRPRCATRCSCGSSACRAPHAAASCACWRQRGGASTTGCSPRPPGSPSDELADALREAVAAQVLVPAATAAPTSSGTRCCARPPTRSCCRASGERLHAALARELEARPELAGPAPRSPPSSPITGTRPGERDRALAASVRGGGGGRARLRPSRGAAALPARARAVRSGRAAATSTACRSRTPPAGAAERRRRARSWRSRSAAGRSSWSTRAPSRCGRACCTRGWRAACRTPGAGPRRGGARRARSR